MDQLNSALARRAATFSASKQMKVEGTITGCMTLVALFVTLRVYRRLFATRNWGLDDYLCTAGAVITLAYGAAELSFYGPLGPKAPPNKFTPRVARTWYTGIVLYPVGAMLVKLSLCALYWRLFASGSSSTRRLVIAGSVALVLFYPTMAFMTLGLCAPRGRETFAQAKAARRCTRPGASRFYIMSAFNIASDVFLFAVPVRVVARLQMPARRKLAVCALFFVGLIACVCAVLRIVFYQMTINPRTKGAYDVHIHCVTFAEITICIICACMPVVWPACAQAWAVLAQLPSYTLSLLRSGMSRRGSGSSSSGSSSNCNAGAGHHAGAAPPPSPSSAGTPNPGAVNVKAEVIVTLKAAGDDGDSGKAPWTEEKAGSNATGRRGSKWQFWKGARGSGGPTGFNGAGEGAAARPAPKLPRVPERLATLTGLRSLFGGGGGGGGSRAHGSRMTGVSTTWNDGGTNDAESGVHDYYHAQLRAAAAPASPRTASAGRR